MAIVPGFVTAWNFALWALEVSPETVSKLRYFGLSRRTFWEVFLGLVVLSIVVVSIEGAFRVVRRRERADESVRKLALLIQQGHAFRDKCASIYESLPAKDIERWTATTEDLLGSLGNDYLKQFAVRLKRPTPITTIETLGTIQKNIPSREHYDQWKLLGYRLERLEEYLANLLAAK